MLTKTSSETDPPLQSSMTNQIWSCGLVSPFFKNSPEKWGIFGWIQWVEMTA